MALQLLKPNPNIPSEPGMCLQYVRQTFGLPIRYGSATEAWYNASHPHADRDFPEGVDHPVWYGLVKNVLGHVVLRMADGSVYSTSDNNNIPHHHESLEDLEAYYEKYDMPLYYRGWSEDVAGYPVIVLEPSEEDDMANLFADRDAFKAAVVEAVFGARYDTRDEKNNITGTITLKDLLTYYPANIALDRRQLREGLTASVTTIVEAAAKTGQKVDPKEIAKQIADELEGLTFSVARSKD